MAVTRYKFADRDLRKEDSEGEWIKYKYYARLLEDFEELKDTNSEMHLNFKAYRDQIQELTEKINELTQENDRLTALFNMQHKRSITADRIWQQATGNIHVLPDLGVLLSWFMEDRAIMLGVFENVRDELDKVMEHKI